MPQFSSKLPGLPDSIFSVMSALAQRHQAINLSQGFPNFETAPRLLALAQHYMQAGPHQYAPMPGVPRLNEVLSQKIAGLYGQSYHPAQEITITAGATQALFTAITALVHPGDEVIIFEPAYDSYRPALELCGAKVLAYPLQGPDWRPDFERLAAMLSPRTRLILVNSPHNPTGSVWPEADWQALSALLAGTDILLLSDEVYEHLCFEGVKHHSVLGQPGLRERSLAVFSFGKTLHATGWKLGYIVGDAALMREFRKVHQFNVFSVNTPLQHAIADYLAEPETYLGLGSFFEAKRDFLSQALADSPFNILPCQGTYFLLLDYSALSQEPDRQLAERLILEAGVATIPVSAFYQDGQDAQLLRLCFAKTEQTLSEAAERLCAWARGQ